MNVAIIEDNAFDAKTLMSFLERYSEEKGLVFALSPYKNAGAFLADSPTAFALVFMDIQMEGINGMEAAKKLREIDPFVPLVFTTSLADYASTGYRVQAADYLVKPFRYETLAFALDALLPRLEKAKEGVLMLHNAEGSCKLSLASLLYIEVRRHHLFYHADERDFEAWGSLKEAKASLPEKEFALAGASFLVHLSRVDRIEGENLFLGSHHVKISRQKRKAFLEALNCYIAERRPGK